LYPPHLTFLVNSQQNELNSFRGTGCVTTPWNGAPSVLRETEPRGNRAA
jgi:hypothetical protein